MPVDNNIIVQDLAFFLATNIAEITLQLWIPICRNRAITLLQRVSLPMHVSDAKNTRCLTTLSNNDAGIFHDITCGY